MTETPDGWSVARLGDLADTSLGKMLDAARPKGATVVPYLRNLNVQWGRVELEDLQTVPLSDGEIERFALEPGDLLVCEGGEIGRAAVWKGQRGYMAYQKALHRVRGRGDLDMRYLRYLLEHYANQGMLRDRASGSTILHLPQRQLRELSISHPPIGEQLRIVEILEDHLSRLDAAEEWLGRVVARRAMARGAVFQSAITRSEESAPVDLQALRSERARRFPPGTKRGRPHPAPAAEIDVPWRGAWRTVSLEEVTDPIRTISYGILKPGPNLELGVPYVRVLNMREDRIAADDLHRTSFEIAERYSRARLAAGDLLVSIRGTYGRVAIVPPSLEGANITQDTARLAVLPQILPSFLALVLRSPWAQAYMKGVARGVGVKGVNIGDLRRMPVPVPSLAEQTQVVVRVEALVSDVEAAAASAQSAHQRSVQLRHAVLAAAFSGRLNKRSVRAAAKVEEVVGV